MLGKINAPLNDRLKAIKWGRYRIGDIFQKLPTKKAEKAQVRNYKNKEFCIPVVYCKYGDNGIMYWGRKNEFTTYQNVISVIYNGVISAGKVYAQKNDTGILAESYFIKVRGYKTSHRANLFLASSLEKALYYKYSRDYLATWDGKVEDEMVFLPVSNGEIDFAFMDSFIAELEGERIAKLSALLTVIDLTNYELSKEEKAALQNYTTLKWAAYNLKTLFGKSTRGKRLKSEDRIPGTLPFVTAGEAEEGVSAFIGNDVEVFEKNTTTIDMFGSAKYRNYRYGGDDHVAIVHTEALPMRAAIFVTAACHKAAHTGKFDYGNNFYAKDADALNIMLPSKNGKPDYHMMEILISAIQKSTIKEVVRYASQKNLERKRTVKQSSHK